jgi:hypothetical protein
MIMNSLAIHQLMTLHRASSHREPTPATAPARSATEYGPRTRTDCAIESTVSSADKTIRNANAPLPSPSTGYSHCPLEKASAVSDTNIQMEPAPVHRPLLSFWPIALGLAVATFQIMTGIAAESVAITVSVAASCYLVGAVFGRPWTAWATVLGGSMVVVLSELASVRWWIGLAGFAALLLVIGLVRKAPTSALTAQGLAMAGFGGIAVIAVLVSPRLGSAMAGIALTAHALWDYRHWRRKDVVPRSFTEFCMVLDIPFGIAAIVVAFTG